MGHLAILSPQRQPLQPHRKKVHPLLDIYRFDLSALGFRQTCPILSNHLRAAVLLDHSQSRKVHASLPHLTFDFVWLRTAGAQSILSGEDGHRYEISWRSIKKLVGL